MASRMSRDDFDAIDGAAYQAARLTWGLILASLRHLPFEVERLKQGHWHTTVSTRLEGNTLGVYAFGHIGGVVARVGRAFGHLMGVGTPTAGPSTRQGTALQAWTELEPMPAL